MSKKTKGAMIQEIRKRIGDAKDFVIVDSSRIDAIRTNEWRLKLAEKDITAFTVKNSLAKLALHDAGIEALDPYLNGPSTLIWGSSDVVELTKAIQADAKAIAELEIKGGAVEGVTSLDAAAVEKLSKSPGRQELLSMIAGAILGPGGQLAGAIKGPGGQLAGAIKSLSEEEDGDGDG